VFPWAEQKRLVLWTEKGWRKQKQSKEWTGYFNVTFLIMPGQGDRKITD
jgi:hypothetical protein